MVVLFRRDWQQSIRTTVMTKKIEIRRRGTQKERKIKGRNREGER